MMPLTPKRRRELRAQAHSLHVVVSVGQVGLTPQVLHEIDVALRAHGLIKVRVFSDDRAQRERMLSRIADELAAAPVQHLGKLLIFWRPLEEKPPKRATRSPRKTTAQRGSGGTTRPRGVRTAPESHRVLGRARGPTAFEAIDTAGHSPRGRTARAATGKSPPNPRRRRRAI